MNTWFIIWLIGAIVSTYVTCKYAEPIQMYKNILKYKNGIHRILPIIFVSITIVGYTVLSWLGAFATYVTFNDFDDYD